MPKERLIALNGSGGAYTSIAASIPCRRWEIMEDGSVTAQGLSLKYPDDSFTQAYVYGAGQGIDYGNIVANQNNQGPVLGYPAQPASQPSAYNGGSTYNAGDTALYTDANSVTRSYTCLVNNTVGVTPGVNANWTISRNWRPADTLVQARSATASTTSVRFIEWE